MVRRMPFPRGKEIHGLLPCSKGEETTSGNLYSNTALPLRGKAAEAHPWLMLGQVHMVVALV